MILPDRGAGPEFAADDVALMGAPTESGSPALSAALPGALSGTEFVTMAEAARIKGVSYHTVSRAVRHGRLPVERVGRMALISATDLQAWRPMTERRPRRYQQRDVLLARAGFGLADGSDAAGLYASMVEHIMADATTLGLDRFLARCSERIATDLGCSSLSIWACGEESSAPIVLTQVTQIQAGPEGWFVAARVGPPRRLVPTSDSPLVALLGSAGAQEVPARLLAADGISSAAEFLLIAPIRASSRPIGLLVGELGGGGLPDGELRVLDHLLKQVAFGWGMIQERRTRDERIRTLEAALDAAPVGIRLIEGTTVRFRNRQDAVLFADGSPMAKMLDDDLVRHGDSGGDLVLQDALGHCVDVELIRAPDQLDEGDGGQRLIVVSQDQSEQLAERDREERMVRALRRDVVRARAASDLARLVQGASTVGEVIRRGMPTVIATIEGTSALVKVRGQSGKLERIAFGDGDVSTLMPDKLSPLSYPSTVLAFARRQPVVVTRNTAATFELEAMELAGWQSALVVPMVVKDEQLGFLLVGYGEDAQADRTIIGLASELAQVLAEAILTALDHERLTADLRQVFDVLDQVPQAVLISQGHRGLVSYANPAARQLWQWAEGECPRTMLDLPVLDSAGELYDDHMHPLITGVRTGRSSLGEPLTIRTFRGDTIEVMATIAPVEGPGGTVTGSVAILQDRSQLRKLDEAKEAFVATVAHELRNPLTAVIGNVQLLERRIARVPGAVSPDVQRRVETIGRQVGVLSGLVSRLLDRSRLEFAQLDIRPVPTDAVVLVERACADSEPMLEGRALVVAAPTRLPVVWDEVRMGQVMSNLLSNAVRYGAGTIDVRVEGFVAGNAPHDDAIAASDTEAAVADMVRIVVRDHGTGFPADQRTHLFSPHVRIDEASPLVDSRGLGIGLYLSERMIAAHGGTITAANADDGGAMVTIEVPMVVEAASVRAEGRAYVVR